MPKQRTVIFEFANKKDKCLFNYILELYNIAHKS